MEIVSEIIKIKQTENISSQYVENELSKRGIKPLRWAIVKISKYYFTINIAYAKMT